MSVTELFTKTELLEAYREGCEVTVPEWNQQLYVQTLGDLVALHSGVEVAKALSHFWMETLKGLEATREGQLEAAKTYLDIGEELLATFPKDRIGRTLAEGSFLAKRSYLHYRHGRYDEATRDFEEAYRADSRSPGK